MSKFYNFDQRSEKWHKVRRQHITSTEVAAIMGMDPYRTADEIVQNKTGIPPEYKPNTAMMFGISFENTAIQQYIDSYKMNNVSDFFWVTGIVSKGILAASPDLLIGTSGLAEFKCPAYALRKTIPSTHMCQMQTCMWVTDRKWCDYVQWMPGDRMQVERVAFDPDMMKNIIDETTAFWETRVKPLLE